MVYNGLQNKNFDFQCNGRDKYPVIPDWVFNGIPWNPALFTGVTVWTVHRWKPWLVYVYTIRGDEMRSEQLKNWHISWAYNLWTTRLNKFWPNDNFCKTQNRTIRSFQN